MTVYRFAQFCLDPTNRKLSRGDERLTLPSKAFDLLCYLIEREGRLVTKDELLTNVWSDQIVEESNLTVQISQLRKALGESSRSPQFIETVPGHGYRFIGSLKESRAENLQIETSADPEPVSEETIEYLASIKDREEARPERFEVPRSPILVVTLVAALSVVVFAMFVSMVKEAPADPRLRSLAILPFKPLVSTERDAALELGLADTLITKLGRIRDLEVRPISAVSRYSGSAVDAVASGVEQKVDAVLEGHIQKSGEKIKVTVRLVRVGDGVQLWTDQFYENWTDVFAVQDSIAERLAVALLRTIEGRERTRFELDHTQDPEAYRLYLMGRYHLAKLTDQDFFKALEYFERSARLDPGYAFAYVGIADCYTRLSGWNAIAPAVGFPKARDAALKALEIDQELAEAHTALGLVKHFYDWDWDGAEREFKLAIELNPNSSEVHQYYSYFLSASGRFDEAFARMQRASELDPLSIEKLSGLGEIFYFRRNFDRAIEQYQKVLDMNPNLGFAHWALSNVYVEKGEFDKAIVGYNKAISLSGNSPDEPAMLGYTLALAGKGEEARAILSVLKLRAQEQYVPPTVIAFIYIGLDEKDEAFTWLEKGIAARDPLLVLLRAMPPFARLEGDPRFGFLKQRIGIPGNSPDNLTRSQVMVLRDYFAFRSVRP